MPVIRVAAAQINTAVGDVEGNTALIKDAIRQAFRMGCDVVAFPELSVTGYPPEDLLLSDSFVRASQRALDEISEHCEGIVAVIGTVDFIEDRSGTISHLFNAAAILAKGTIIAIYHKKQLPNYGVFDELRYFTPGNRNQLITVNSIPIGVNICEDLWVTPGPGDEQCAAGAKVIITINSSPYEIGKLQTRTDIVTSLAKRGGAFAVYTNQVGGQDELVFDGGSIFVNPEGEVIHIAPRFEESITAVDLHIPDQPLEAPKSTDKSSTLKSYDSIPIELPSRVKPQLPAIAHQTASQLHDIYSALVVGTRDYIAKTGFRKAAIALSGGIDSALVACIAVDAIGAENVVGVSLPSRYSSEGSVNHAEELADRLQIPLWRIPIEAAHSAFELMLQEHFKGLEHNVAEENVQSRIRGNVMMTIANKFGWLVLSTGNKSEMATGYATLYGDMAGGFAVIKDIPKQMVYELAEHRNAIAGNAPIPRAVIDKPPSAELKPDQLDEDSLPQYSVLDRVLHSYIEDRKSCAEIIRSEVSMSASNHADPATVARIIDMVDRNEYKRRQAAPGVKITGLAFGKDRRLPIASRWRHSSPPS